MTNRYRHILDWQREFFHSGATRDLRFRKKQLNTLQHMIQAHEGEIAEALYRDLRKPAVEAFAGEIAFLAAEARYCEKRLAKWAKPIRTKTMLFHKPARSVIMKDPYGIVCIIGPWNYPFQLVLSPLIGAIAAGNCAVIKPSETSRHTSELIETLIGKYFDSAYIAVVQGNSSDTQELLRLPFDYIFFTGGSETGRAVMQAAAANLTPCTLELGGKNPCIVTEDADIVKAAKRIVWGKFFNAGQTCAAPDYLLVRDTVKKSLIEAIRQTITDFYGENPQKSPDFARIVNRTHFNRLTRLMENGDIVHGGMTHPETLYMAPTVIDNVSQSDSIMQEEIFGPLLPILTFASRDELIRLMQEQSKPLALYIFSKDHLFIDRVLRSVPSGSACVNGTFSQLISYTLPFGGVGTSGMGRYHGRYSFDTFTYEKSILYKSLLWDNGLFYPPYKTSLRVIKKALNMLLTHR